MLDDVLALIGTMNTRIGINTFSLIDLLAVVITTHVMLIFFYRYARVTRRKTDLLFSFLVLLVWVGSVLVFVTDNLVPSGTPSTSVPNAASRDLLLTRLIFINGAFMVAATAHFVLRYTQSNRMAGHKAIWLYAGVTIAMPLVFSNRFLVICSTPISETSSWVCEVPWTPATGPLVSVYFLFWLGVNIWIQRMLLHRPQPVVRDGVLRIHTNIVWVGITLWGIAGLADIVAVASGYLGVDVSVCVQVVAMVVLAVGLAEEHAMSERERAHVTRRFQSYVDPSLVKFVIEHPESERIDGERREMTVVFTDLEGFTPLTERLGEDVVPLLNEYLKFMVPLIRDHNGYRSKFLGDGMMFFYGAPERNPDHAIHAVATVLKMQEMMVKFNQAITEKRQHLCDNTPMLQMRTGVSSGPMIVGDAGPLEASDYTVMGETVNLGARLESANKLMGTRILLSERTVELLPRDLFLLRPIGRLQVVGSARAVMTYEPLAHLNQASDLQRRTTDLTRAMIEQFIQGHFTECLEALNLMDREIGSSKLTENYRRWCEEYQRSAPEARFRGEIVMSEK